MKRAAEAILRLWKLRNSESRKVRVRWWLILGLLACCLFVLGNLVAGLTLVLWIVGNSLLGIVSFGWMLFHPRALGRSSNTAIVWSRWLTIISLIGLYTGITSTYHSVTPGIVLTLSLFASPFIFVIFLLFSLFGGSLGAFIRRRNVDVEQFAAASVVGWWMAVILTVVFVAAQDILRFPESFIAPVIMGTPVFAVLLAQLLRRLNGDKNREPLRLVDIALKRLIVSVGRKNKVRTIDLRGVTIGLFSAAIVLWIAKPIIAPIQQNVLAAMFRLRWQGYQYLHNFGDKGSRVVFVKFDTSATAAAMTRSSESAQQAAMIRRLTHDEAAAVILPAPTIDPKLADLGDSSTAAVDRTIRDLPDLTAAVTKNGKIIVIVTPEQRKAGVLAPLLAAAYGVAQFGEEPAGSALLATIPITWNQGQDPPAPLVALGMQKKSRSPLTIRKIDAETASVNGIPVSTALPDRIVVDVSTNGRKHGGDTPTFALSSLLDGSASLPKTLRSSDAKDIDSYMTKKTVILEPLIHGDIDTPLGLMPRFEALASAINALLYNAELQPGNPDAAVIWALILGVLIGSQSVGRDPLQASWRVAVLMLLNFGYSLAAFVLMGLWADPVLPLVAATVAFLLVTQFTFSIERDERERNRALFSRFIAPGFVEELLTSTTKTLALGGEKRTVCVLFVDVRNFTGFAESHAPEEVIEIMNIYLTALTDALDQYGGLLDKYTGDGLMAFFEIKGDVRTELIRSVNASLAMRDSAIAVSDRMMKAGRTTLDIGIGMHYGEAIVGLVGNEQRQINYTALGHTVVVSARLQTLAEGGDVVVSEPIFAVVSDAFEFSPMSPVFVKGITAEQRPYQVTRRV